jgi:hypothetical protein
MIRTLCALLVILGGLLLGGRWLTRQLGSGALPAALPRLHTVDLNDLVDSALAREGAVPEPAPRAPQAREERLPAPAPFVEAPLPEPAEPPEPDEASAPEPGSLVLAARDQDAWAALIRRMLDLQRRAGPQ